MLVSRARTRAWFDDDDDFLKSTRYADRKLSHYGTCMPTNSPLHITFYIPSPPPTSCPSSSLKKVLKVKSMISFQVINKCTIINNNFVVITLFLYLNCLFRRLISNHCVLINFNVMSNIFFFFLFFTQNMLKLICTLKKNHQYFQNKIFVLSDGTLC